MADQVDHLAADRNFRAEAPHVVLAAVPMVVRSLVAAAALMVVRNLVAVAAGSNPAVAEADSSFVVEEVDSSPAEAVVDSSLVGVAAGSSLVAAGAPGYTDQEAVPEAVHKAVEAEGSRPVVDMESLVVDMESLVGDMESLKNSRQFLLLKFHQTVAQLTRLLIRLARRRALIIVRHAFRVHLIGSLQLRCLY